MASVSCFMPLVEDNATILDLISFHSTEY